MDIDYEYWKFWMAAANFIGTALLAAYIFVTNRSRVNTSRINKLEDHTSGEIEGLRSEVRDQIKDHDNRLARIEERNRHMPTHEDFKRVHVRLDQLSEDYKEQKGEFKGAINTLNMIHQYLLNEEKK